MRYVLLQNSGFSLQYLGEHERGCRRTWHAMWTKTGGNAVRARGSEKAGEKIEERKRKDKGREEYVGFADRSSIATFIIDTEALEEPIPLPSLIPCHPPSPQRARVSFSQPSLDVLDRTSDRKSELASSNACARAGGGGGRRESPSFRSSRFAREPAKGRRSPARRRPSRLPIEPRASIIYVGAAGGGKRGITSGTINDLPELRSQPRARASPIDQLSSARSLAPFRQLSAESCRGTDGD